jgi:hypothetical protein
LDTYHFGYQPILDNSISHQAYERKSKEIAPHVSIVIEALEDLGIEYLEGETADETE